MSTARKAVETTGSLIRSPAAQTSSFRHRCRFRTQGGTLYPCL